MVEHLKTRTYNLYDEVISETMANGLSQSFTYDKFGNLTGHTLPDQSQLAYTYDPLKLKTLERISKEDNSLYTHTCLARDMRGNLLHAKLPDTREVSYTYDLNGRLKTLQNPSWQEVLTYDKSGNLTKVLRDNTPTDYTYDDNYQLTSESGPLSNIYSYDSLQNRRSFNAIPYAISPLNEITSVGTSPYTYDQNENLTGYDDFTFTYDVFNRLITATKKETFTLHFTYDPFGRLMSRTCVQLKSPSLETLDFFYLNDTLIGASSLGQIRHLKVGPVIEREGIAYASLSDFHGSVIDLGSDHFTYTAFGDDSTASANPWRFLGQWHDTDLHLYFIGKRIYSPSLGR
jgi:YD repeat-containing protein